MIRKRNYSSHKGNSLSLHAGSSETAARAPRVGTAKVGTATVGTAKVGTVSLCVDGSSQPRTLASHLSSFCSTRAVRHFSSGCLMTSWSSSRCCSRSHRSSSSCGASWRSGCSGQTYPDHSLSRADYASPFASQSSPLPFVSPMQR